MAIQEEQTGTKTEITEETRTKYGQISGAVGIACNLVLAGSKLGIGLLSGAVSIVADAVNNFSDAASSIVSLIGFRLAARPADEEHPFGHARYEYLSGLIVAFLVLLAGVELLKSSVGKILHPEPVEFSLALVAVLVLSILVKLWMAFFNHRMGKKIDSGVLLATAEDSRNDCISTGVVLIGAVVSHLAGVQLDGIMGVLVAAFIFYSGFSLMKDTTAPLLGETPDPQLVKKIRDKIMSYPDVMGTHDLMVHDYGPGRRFASVHIEMSAEADVLHCHEIIDKIEHDFMKEENLHMVVHYDPIETSNSQVGELRSFMAEQVRDVHQSLSMHDLRIVPGEENTNVIFDCVIPYGCPLTDEEVVQELKKRLAAAYPKHTAVIEIDRSFVEVNS